MTAAAVLFQREARAAFASVSFYVQAAAFLAASGWSLVDALRRGEGGFVLVPALWVGSVAFWLPFLSALATMRSFSAERASGTLETLLTAPISESQVVWGKFHSAFLTGLTGLALAGLAPVVLLPWLSPRLADGIAAWPLVAGMVTLMIQLALWTAVGLFFSLAWEQQAAAAACSLFVCLVVPLAVEAAVAAWFPGVSLAAAGFPAAGWAADAASGLLTLAPVVCYGAAARGFLFLTTLLLEARQIRTG
jgi:ABC-2 type transport system permease protein